MPTAAAHIAQARRNREFYDTIDKDRFPDWAAIALFYTALHCIDALLGSRNPPIHPSDHGSRDNAVSSSPELSSIYDEYRKLKNDSYAARYYPPYKQDRKYVALAETLYYARVRAAVAAHVKLG